MSKLAASSRAFTLMLPYSQVETDMPFSLFPKPAVPLQSRSRIQSRQPTGNQNARPSRCPYGRCGLLAGGYICDFAALRCPAGALRAGCRAFAADRARARRFLDARRPVDDRSEE